MTIEDVLKALDRYTRESNESDRRTAAMVGIKRATLIAWLQGTDSPQKCILARLAGFLRRVGYGGRKAKACYDKRLIDRL
jgi:transcriptional regulator with XRE-family HTH domain